MTYFECIGIPFIDEQFTGARFQQMAAAGLRWTREDGGDQITWTDESGAVMFFNTDASGATVCARPAFHSGADFVGIAKGWASDPDGCRFCDPLLARQTMDGVEADMPFVFHLANGGAARAHIGDDGALDLIVTGFALDVRLWKNEKEFRKANGGKEAQPHMLGLTYDPKQPSPEQYFLTGAVLSAELRRNTVTNVSFWSLWLDTPFGGSGNGFGLVAREQDLLTPPKRGNIVSASVWACAVAMFENDA
jgi:hypothetical protein